MAVPARRLSLAVALVALMAAPTARAGDFFSAVRDLPLMPGLEERPEAAVVFDHEGGQVTTALATGPLEEAAVRQFYLRALPPLGWAPECAAPRCPLPDRYRREGESLELEVAAEDGETAARFLLTRRPANP